MTNRKLVPIAAIKSPHGVKGMVLIHPYSGDAESLTAYGPLTDKNGEQEFHLIPEFEKKSAMVCRIRGFDDRTAVEKLSGMELYIDRAKMPDTAENDGEFYYSDLEGLEIRSPKGDVMGRIVRVQNFGAGDMLDAEINNETTGKKESHFIPFTDTCVPVVNVKGGYVTITPPRGLFSGEEKQKKNR